MSSPVQYTQALRQIIDTFNKLFFLIALIRIHLKYLRYNVHIEIYLEPLAKPHYIELAWHNSTMFMSEHLKSTSVYSSVRRVDKFFFYF